MCFNERIIIQLFLHSLKGVERTCYEKRRSKKKFNDARRLKTEGVSTSEIARRLDMRRATLVTWLKEDEYQDDRGWNKGAHRKYTKSIREEVIALKKRRIESGKYFTGSTYIQMEYAKAYPERDLPSLWFIEEVTREAGLQTRKPKPPKGKGVVARQLFPIKSIVTLGRIHQSCDFIGKKYITGSSVPINIFSTSYYQWLGLYNIWRTTSESSDSVLDRLSHFWLDHPIPQVMRIDNAMTFRGNPRGAEVSLSRFLKFLLNTQVTPLFSSPHRSYTNPHIEGHNRTFTEKLWGKHTFTSMKAIDRECALFNAESEELFRWKYIERLAAKGLRYADPAHVELGEVLHRTYGKKICFIRFVDIWKEANNEVGIVVLDRFVDIPIAYLNQYVFAVFELDGARLIVYSEYEGVRTMIHTIAFPYH